MCPVDDADEGCLLPAKIYLIDRSEKLAEEWRVQFADCPEVEVRAGDYFQQPAAAIVSPANSFGIMDGGIDLALRDVLGFAVERRLQEIIVERHHGELPVGSAEVVATGHRDWPWLIAAPTMRVPEPIPYTLNAYQAFRAVLVACEHCNRSERRVDSLVCCGLGTGVGRMHPGKCARQMRAAYQIMKTPSRIPSFDGIHAFHQALLLM